MMFSPLTDQKKSNRDWYIHDCTCTCMHEYWKLKKSKEGVRGIILLSLENSKVRGLFTGIWNSYIYSTIRYLVSQTYLYLVLPFNKSQCCIYVPILSFFFLIHMSFPSWIPGLLWQQQQYRSIHSVIPTAHTTTIVTATVLYRNKLTQI